MIEIYQDTAGEWRFRVKAGNGEIVATSEGYTSQADAGRGASGLIALLSEKDEKIERLEVAAERARALIRRRYTDLSVGRQSTLHLLDVALR